MGRVREIIKSIFETVIPSYRSIRRLENRVEELYRLQSNRMDTLFWYGQSTPEMSLLDTKKRFFQTMPKAEGTLRIIQLGSTCLLRRLKIISEKHNISFWLSFGTLLGAARHEGFVPWDDDIDISMLRDDFERFQEAVLDDEEITLKSFYHSGTKRYIFKLLYRGCDEFFWVDITIWDFADVRPLGEAETWTGICAARENAYTEITRTLKHAHKKYGGEPVTAADDARIQACFQKHRLTPPEQEYATHIYRGIDSIYLGGETLLPVNDVFPLKKLAFEGDLYPVPAGYEQYLTYVYHYLDFPDRIAPWHIPLSASAAEQVEKYVRELGLVEEIQQMNHRA